MKISRSLLPALLFVASVLVMLTIADIKTTCNRVQDGVCYQSCKAAGCTMECLDSEDYHSCSQVCKGGNCNMTCDATTACAFSCVAGGCQTAICYADICQEFCAGEGCGLECHGSICEQICPHGYCELQCPSDARMCLQSCPTNTCSRQIL